MLVHARGPIVREEFAFESGFVGLLNCLVALLLFQAPAAGAAITGTVVRADSGAAVPGPQITVVRYSESVKDPISESDLITIMGDDRGRFVVPNLSAGLYRLFAAHNGFVRTEYGQRATGRRGTALRIVEGQQLRDLTIRMQPTGSITGRVFGADGEALTGFMVELLQTAYDSTGEAFMRRSSFARTDDRGEYRLYWVTPGRYYVRVNPFSEFDDDQFRLAKAIYLEAGQGDGPPREGLETAGLVNLNAVFSRDGLVPTYYPNTTERSGGQLLEVRAGAELSGVNIQVVPQPVSRVGGRVVNAAGEPVKSGFVVLRSQDGTRFEDPIGNDSSFEFGRVTPGWYQLVAMSSNRDGERQDLRALTEVQVAGSNVENLLLTARPGVSASGVVQFEGGLPPANAAEIGSARVVIVATSSDQGNIRAADGYFKIDQVFPGEYWVRLEHLPSGTYLKEARSAGLDVFARPLVVSERPDPIDIEIVVGTKTGRIEGLVTDAILRPVPAAEVVLIPNGPRPRRELYRQTQADERGQFRIENVPAGEYKAFVWEDLEPFSYFASSVLERYEAAGAAVHVREGASATVTVKVIPPGTIP